jgi:carboxymethylenebutenolidase
MAAFSAFIAVRVASGWMLHDWQEQIARSDHRRAGPGRDGLRLSRRGYEPQSAGHQRHQLTDQESMVAVYAVLVALSIGGGAVWGQMPRQLSASGARPVVSGILLHPEGRGAHPAVILLPGAGGWRAEYLDFGKALTEAGFVTLTLDYYVETGGAAIGSQDKLAKWPSWQTTVRAAVELVRRLPTVNGEAVGLLGFSRGAFLAVSVAGSISSVKAVIDLYGGGAGGTATVEEEVQHLPPLLILHGQVDNIVPVRFARELYDACQRAGRTVELHLYPGIGHAFTLSTFSTYSKDATHDATDRAIRFLRRWLTRP